MAKRMLSRTEVIKAHELFKLHLVPAERDGYFKYQDGWDDAKISQELDPSIQATSIARLRSELFGHLDTTANAAREDNGRIKALETIVENMLKCYGELEIKHNKLVDTLHLNKVVNVSHLKTTVKEGNGK